MNKYAYPLLFSLILLPLVLQSTGCSVLDWLSDSGLCCYSPVAALPFLVLAIVQMKKQ